MRPLLADRALAPTAADIADAKTRADELLRLRRSTPLFHLGTAALVQRKVTFPLGGEAHTPGVITMRIDDRAGPDVDPRLAGVVVVFNATPGEVTQTVPATRGDRYRLHPVQRGAGTPSSAPATTTPAPGPSPSRCA